MHIISALEGGRAPRFGVIGMLECEGDISQVGGREVANPSALRVRFHEKAITIQSGRFARRRITESALFQCHFAATYRLSTLVSDDSTDADATFQSKRVFGREVVTVTGKPTYSSRHVAVGKGGYGECRERAVRDRNGAVSFNIRFKTPETREGTSISKVGGQRNSGKSAAGT